METLVMLEQNSSCSVYTKSQSYEETIEDLKIPLVVGFAKLKKSFLIFYPKPAAPTIRYFKIFYGFFI